MKKILLVALPLFFFATSFSQYNSQLPADKWVDSVFKTLSKKQKIAQLMIVRAHSNLGEEHVAEVKTLIKKYKVGGLIFFQGGPVRQANLTNYYQSISKTPLLISIDGEWGLGMRLDSVINFPRQLMMGAMPNAKVVYQVGKAIGEQCKRMGIQVNFAPVVDVNNNPNNPVINDRSFGEDKYKVALFGVQYMKGMQDAGVMACAKHFPGHGDVAVDSHLDLPVINKTRSQLDSLELYPFRQMIKEGVGSIMIAHLYIPVIDSSENRATSLSYAAVTSLLKNELGYKGLVLTDALEMKGITKFFPAGEASVQSLIAGNDMLCLPSEIPATIKKIQTAIKQKRLTWADLDARVKKVLLAKYNYGLHQLTPIKTEGLVDDLNKNTIAINKLIAENALTLLKQDEKGMFPYKPGKVAYVGIGLDASTTFGDGLQKAYGAEVFTFGYKQNQEEARVLLENIRTKYEEVIIGVLNYSRRPANNFGLSNVSIQLVNQLQQQMPSITFVFGNPYAISNFSTTATNLIAAYEDDKIVQQSAIDLLQGKIAPNGTLPVTVGNAFTFGAGLSATSYFTRVKPAEVGLDENKLNEIDSIVAMAIAKGATPGCVVLIAKDGKLAFERAYGYTNYDKLHTVSSQSIYDLASVTKTSATTVSIMKLFEAGKLKIDDRASAYLPWLMGTNKEDITIRELLIHQAGMVAWIPFYRETLDKDGYPLQSIYKFEKDEKYSIQVADKLYMRADWVDTMFKRMIDSKVGSKETYVYSDLDFIFLGKIVEAISGKSLAEYANEQFFAPLQMTSTTFKPLDFVSEKLIVPTEYDKNFRQQLLTGHVHDPGAAMFGGISGHAGLFSNANDLSKLYQMLLNGGTLNGVQYLKKSTIDMFTNYNSNVSRRGLGFDKPEKDNLTRKDPYPALHASSLTFGHTGFTGTCVWVDPASNLVYIFLGNRITPAGGENRKLIDLKIRESILDAVYQSILPNNNATPAANK